MSSYAEQLNALRAARAERDKAHDELHQQRLDHLKLLRSQRKAKRKEVDADKATLDQMAALTAQIRDLSEQERTAREKRRHLDQVETDLTNNQKLLSSLTSDLDALQQALATVDSQLNGGNLTPEQKGKLEAERKALLEKIDLLKQRIAALKAQVAELETKVHDGLGQKAQLDEQLHELATKIKQLQEELDHLAEAAPTHEDHSNQLEQG